MLRNRKMKDSRKSQGTRRVRKSGISGIKKEEIEKENPEHKRDVENQRKEEVEEENKSEKKDKLENREDEKRLRRRRGRKQR